jgi:Fe2+ transport system protein FeoA
MTRTAAPSTPSTPVFPGVGDDGRIPLSRVAVGWRRVIEHVDGPDRAELEREGVLPGSVVVVTARTPLGGPVVVELGRARLALSSSVAAQVATRPYTATGGEPG